jgi:hypothetical protein
LGQEAVKQALRLRNQAPKEWKVRITAREQEASMAAARSRISRAALFVKVTARTDSGSTPRSRMR